MNIISLRKEKEKFIITNTLLGKENESTLKFDDLEKAFDQLKDLVEGYNFRICSECQTIFDEGYCFDGGREYYCSDTCLHKHFSEEEWEEICEDDDSQSYWTNWYECTE